MRRLALIGFFLTFLLPLNIFGQAEWTVLVYLNADNNLEVDGLIDFAEMARAGSTEDVNVVVQFDRIGKYSVDYDTDPQWTDTLRFRVTKDLQPIPANALEAPGEQNMGDPRALTEFLAWAIASYPAKKYALIIWDHGDGYRHLTSRQLLYEAEVSAANDLARDPFRSVDDAPHKAVSHDESQDDKLFNQEIQTALKDFFAASNVKKFDVIGFDACLMAMLETNYALRYSADVMIGSQELEPGTGWQYDLWLSELTRRPQIDARDLGLAIVNSYEKRYGAESSYPDPTTTLSAVDLQKIPQAASSLSKFANSLGATLGSELPAVVSARDACREYAPGRLFHHIDIIKFLHEYASRTNDNTLKTAATNVADELQQSVLRSWAGAKRQGNYGSHGLAIYFPRTGSEYTSDPREQGGYQKGNTFYPVEFVQKETWADFLHQYFGARP